MGDVASSRSRPLQVVDWQLGVPPHALITSDGQVTGACVFESLISPGLPFSLQLKPSMGLNPKHSLILNIRALYDFENDSTYYPEAHCEKLHFVYKPKHKDDTSSGSQKFRDEPSALIIPLRDDNISIRAGVYISKVTRQNQKRGFELPEPPFAGVPVSRSVSASTDSKGTGRRYTHVRLQLVGYTAPTAAIDAVADGTKETISDCTCVFVSTLSPPFICQTKPTEATLRSATPVVNRTFVSPLELPSGSVPDPSSSPHLYPWAIYSFSYSPPVRPLLGDTKASELRLPVEEAPARPRTAAKRQISAGNKRSRSFMAAADVEFETNSPYYTNEYDDYDGGMRPSSPESMNMRPLHGGEARTGDGGIALLASLIGTPARSDAKEGIVDAFPTQARMDQVFAQLLELQNRVKALETSNESLVKQVKALEKRAVVPSTSPAAIHATAAHAVVSTAAGSHPPPVPSSSPQKTQPNKIPVPLKTAHPATAAPAARPQGVAAGLKTSPAVRVISPPASAPPLSSPLPPPPASASSAPAPPPRPAPAPASPPVSLVPAVVSSTATTVSFRPVDRTPKVDVGFVRAS